MSLSEQQGRAACQRIMKHTPGPWIPHFNVHEKTPLDPNPENKHPIDILNTNSWDDETHWVCSVNQQFHGPENGWANANLIACAPEMLEALIEFCERVERGEIRSENTYNKFKALIEKATK